MAAPKPSDPREYILRRLAPYDFHPICEIEDCAQHVARATQCTACDEILSWYCMPHTPDPASAPKGKLSRCPECGAEQKLRKAFRLVSLAGWC
jgi:hypothetical protein